MPDCSLGEVSLSFGATDSEEERRRIFSQSDSNDDIRNLILGRAFVLCFCDNVSSGVVSWIFSTYKFSLIVNVKERSSLPRA